MHSSRAARIVAAVWTVASVAIRLLTNLRMVNAYGFNPTGSLGLFGGSKLPLWQAALLPVAVIAGTDILLCYYFHNELYSPLHFSRLFIYPAFALYAVIGRLAIGDGKNWFRIAGGPIVGASVFFLISNFGAWLELTEYYPRSGGGLLACYLAGVPYALNTLAGDMIFTYLAFGLYACLPREATAAETAIAATSDRSAS